MQQPTPMDTATTSEKPKNVHTFPMKLGDAQNKKLHIARFTDQVGLDLNKLAAPIKMIPIQESEEEIKEPETYGMNRQQRRRLMEKYFEKLKELRMKKKIDNSWRMEDNDGDKVFEGLLEGSQTACYCVFMLENNEFKVYPVTNWYNFKIKHKITQTMTLEQAEAHLSNRDETIEKFMSSKFKKEENVKAEGEVKEDEDEGLGKPVRMKREKKEEDNEDEGGEDIATVEGDKGEDIDFEEKISDDEEGLEDEKPDGEDENETKPSEDSEKLTASGKELKSLLKKTQKEEEEFEVSSSEDEDEDEGEEGFDPNALDMYTKPKVSADGKAESSNKRPFPGSDDKNAKKVRNWNKIELIVLKAKVDGGQTEAEKRGEVSEEDVRKAVLLSGKIKTKVLLSKFKAQLTNQNQKARFADIVKKLCDIVDEFGEKWLVLKETFRGGLKVPK